MSNKNIIDSSKVQENINAVVASGENVGQARDIVMSVDAGKYDLKAVGKDVEGTTDDIEKLNFRAKKLKTEDEHIDVEGKSFKVKYNNELYVVGEQGETEPEDFSTSKNSLLHQLCAYTAITQLLEPDTKGNKIHMVLACPLSAIKAGIGKEEYRNRIKGDGVINLQVDDENYSFEIEDVMIKAEGSGVINLYPEVFKDKKVAILDFGGLNLNFCVYENGVALTDTRDTLQLGSSRLVKFVGDALSAYLKGDILSTEESEKALNDGHLMKLGSVDSESIQPINDAKDAFVQTAIKEVCAKGVKLDKMDGIVLVGGTSKKIIEAFRKPFPNAFMPNDPQWSTAEGLYRVAWKKYAKKK